MTRSMASMGSPGTTPWKAARADCLDESCADPLTRMIRMNRDLIDVGVEVDNPRQYERDRPVVFACRDPSTTFLLVHSELVDRWRLVVGDRHHPDPTERFASRPFDVAQRAEIVTCPSPPTQASTSVPGSAYRRTSWAAMEIVTNGSFSGTQCGAVVPP